jgi:hypothetical protein
MLPILMAGMYMPRIQLWEVGAGRIHVVAEIDGMPECAAVQADRSICVTRSARQTSLLAFDSLGMRPLGDLPVRLATAVALGPGATVTAAHGAGILHVDVDSRRARDIRVPGDSSYLVEARVAGEHLVVIHHDGAQSRLVVYRLK